MRRFGLLMFGLAFLTALLSGCFGLAKGKIVDPERVEEAVRVFEEENLRLEPVKREKEWILEGVRPARYTLFDPTDELDASLREQLSIYVFKSEEHRIAGLEDFHRQTAALNMIFPRIYAHEEIMLLYWAVAALDETARFGETLERIINRLAGSLVYFNAAHAVDQVLQLHPEFPKPGKTGTVTLPVGDPASGLTVEGVTRTEVEPETSAETAANTETDAEEDAFIVTLVKAWRAEIGGKPIISTWRYRVTRDKVELLESLDQDWRLELITSGGGPEDKSYTQEQLGAIKDHLVAHTEKLLEEHDVQMIMAAVGDGHVMINVRSYGDVEREIGNAELEAIRASLYELVGFKFPLEIGIRDCCRSEADVTGKIAAVDAGKRQVLIIDESRKNGNTDDPYAVFVTLTPDGIIVAPDEEEPVSFADLSVGQQVRAWSTGLMLQSYPGQTSAVKIEIAE